MSLMVKNETVIFLALMGLALVCKPALALPTFTRQTGQPCSACHLNVSELTPAGRTFKLHGYTEGRAVIPLSVTAVGSVTKISSTSSRFAPEISLPKNGEPIFETASLYAAGRYWNNLGGYLKLTLNAANTDPLYSSPGQLGRPLGRQKP